MSDVDIQTVTLQTLISEVRRRNIFPNQLFSIDEMKKDRELAPIFEKVEKTEADLKAANDALKVKDDALKAKDTEIEQAKKTGAVETANNRLIKLAKDKKLTEEQTNFATKRLEKVKGDIDVSDQGLENFLTEQMDIYKDVPGAAGSTKGTTGGESDAGGSIDPTDYSKAANNPMLKADLE